MPSCSGAGRHLTMRGSEAGEPSNVEAPGRHARAGISVAGTGVAKGSPPLRNDEAPDRRHRPVPATALDRLDTSEAGNDVAFRNL